MKNEKTLTEMLILALCTGIAAARAQIAEKKAEIAKLEVGIAEVTELLDKHLPSLLKETREAQAAAETEVKKVTQ